MALLLAPLAACGKGGEGDASAKGGEGNANAPLATPTGPPPKTPVMQVTPAPGIQPAWLGARQNRGDPKTAPYGTLLNQSVVDAPSQR
ncbi:hypothetical protein [Sphingomonas sp.]|uniref:hypothetical protein n=1 Tax=Sphingomonas sp. TaxID=28214 RepID=UPI0035C843C0